MTAEDRALLSVVVLARENTGRALCRGLDSLLSQEDADAQVLVLDMNEPGDPFSLSLQEDMRRYPSVRLLPAPRAESLPEALNQMLSETAGAYVAFAAGGDEWQKEKARRQIARLAERPEALCCVCNGVQRLDSAGTREEWILERLPEERGDWLNGMRPLRFSQAVYRKESLLSLGGFDAGYKTPGYAQLDAVIRAGEGRALCLDEPLFTRPFSAETRQEQEDAYQDAKRLFYREYDQMLRSRRSCAACQGALMRLAGRNGLYPQAAVHGALAFLKRPVHFVLSAFSSAAGLLIGGGKRAAAALRLWGIEFSVRRKILKARKRGLQSSERESPPLSFYPDQDQPAIPPRAWQQPLGRAFDKSLEAVRVPSSVTFIPKGMFAGCGRLSRVVIPPSVERIEEGAFAGCEALRYVEVEAGSKLRSIGAYAFAGCRSVRSLLFPNTVSYLGAYAFAGCEGLSSLQFEYSREGKQLAGEMFPILLRKIPRGAFALCRSLTMIHFPEGATLNHIQRCAFLGCAALTTLRVQSSVYRIGAYAFARCESLGAIAMPHIDSVQYLGKGAFLGCGRIEYFQIPLALKVIPASCFEDCTGLKDIKIPATVVRVDQRAFANCSALGRAQVDRRATKCAANAFAGCAVAVFRKDGGEGEE